MTFQRAVGSALASLALCATGAAAQTAPSETAAAAPAGEASAEPPSADCCTVPARTPVVLEIVEPVGSRTSRTRQTFALRLAEPIVVDGQVVAPAGTPGMGEVVHASRAGLLGRAGELILAARFIEIGGVQVRLRSLRMGRSQGSDPTNAMIAGSLVPVVSWFMPFVSGGDIEVPAGTFAEAMTAAETVLPPVATTDPDPSPQEE